MLDNYKNGNNWLSGQMVMHGYEVKDGWLTTRVYYPQLSRRLTQIKVKLPSGQSLVFDKFNNYQGTRYTAYRIRTRLTRADVAYLENLTK